MLQDDTTMLAKDSLHTSSFEANSVMVSSYSVMDNSPDFDFTIVIGRKTFAVKLTEGPRGSVNVAYVRQ